VRYVDACEFSNWHLRVWGKEDPTRQFDVPYRCRSWRHAGECSWWKGAQDFCRVRDALKKYSFWVYAVLTYPSGNYPDVNALYRAGVHQWDHFRKRISRKFGKFQYIQTWEAHQSGYPHCNLVLSNESLWNLVAGSLGAARAWWEEHAVACGFGKITWLDYIYDEEGIAGYLTKLSRELTGTNVKGQVPVNAPSHFRRLRASPRLLPPPHKNPDFTGTMLFCPMPDDERYAWWKKGMDSPSARGPPESGSEPTYIKQNGDNITDTMEVLSK